MECDEALKKLERGIGREGEGLRKWKQRGKSPNSCRGEKAKSVRCGKGEGVRAGNTTLGVEEKWKRYGSGALCHHKAHDTCVVLL